MPLDASELLDKNLYVGLNESNQQWGEGRNLLQKGNAGMETTNYCPEEAKHLIGRFLGDKREVLQKREEAAIVLMGAFSELMEHHGFGAKKNASTGNYEIGAKSGGVALHYDYNTGFYMRNWDVSHLPKGAVEIPLFYNAVSNLWESDTLDDYIVPEPGKPRMRRSALAELANWFIKIVQSSSI